MVCPRTRTHSQERLLPEWNRTASAETIAKAVGKIEVQVARRAHRQDAGDAAGTEAESGKIPGGGEGQVAGAVKQFRPGLDGRQSAEDRIARQQPVQHGRHRAAERRTIVHHACLHCSIDSPTGRRKVEHFVALYSDGRSAGDSRADGIHLQVGACGNLGCAQMQGAARFSRPRHSSDGKINDGATLQIESRSAAGSAVSLSSGRNHHCATFARGVVLLSRNAQPCGRRKSHAAVCLERNAAALRPTGLDRAGHIYAALVGGDVISVRTASAVHQYVAGECTIAARLSELRCIQLRVERRQ